MFLQTKNFLFILSNAYDKVAHIEKNSLILSFLIAINHLQTESFLHPKFELYNLLSQIDVTIDAD